MAGTALSECGTKLHDDKLTQQEACFADYLNTHSKFPLDGLDNLLMGEVSLLAPALDLLREFILVPEIRENEMLQSITICISNQMTRCKILDCKS